jgi:thiol-disulfide isomerase/thioredoxin
VISFDDDYDGVYDDRDSIITAEGKRLSSYLLFKHNSDEAKDLKVECQIAIKRVDSEYQLYVYYVTKSNGEIEINGERTAISFWKSLGLFDMMVGKHRIKRGNPFRLNKEFYRVSSYDPVANTLTISKIDPDEKLYGTSKNLYANETLFEEALAFHEINQNNVANKKYHVLYFWGHWCGPCIRKMGATSNTLNALNNNVTVYNISLLTGNYDDEEIIVDDIVSDYNLPGFSLQEEHNIDLDTRPFIELFDNRTYPNFIVLDAEYKILYIQDDSNISFEEYAATLE